MVVEVRPVKVESSPRASIVSAKSCRTEPGVAADRHARLHLHERRLRRAVGGQAGDRPGVGIRLLEVIGGAVDHELDNFLLGAVALEVEETDGASSASTSSRSTTSIASGAGASGASTASRNPASNRALERAAQREQR